MKLRKETIIGIAVVLTALSALAIATGVYGILYVGIAFVFAIISIALFSKKSAGAKAGAVVLNTDLIYKVLMPSKYKAAIKELEKNEGHEKT